MRSRLTAFLTFAFLMLGTGGVLALNGGADLGLSSYATGSASFAQYRPAETSPPPAPPVTAPPPSAPPAPAPAPTPPAPAVDSVQPAVVVSTGGVATVSCPDTCHIVLSARRGSHLVHVTLTLSANGTTTVRLSKRELRQLGRGSAVVIVKVNGKVVATRKVRVT